MSWLDRIFKRDKKSAKVAKERLMIAIATDRSNNLSSYMDDMRADIIKVLEKYIKIDNVNIKKEKKGDTELLEIEVLMKN